MTQTNEWLREYVGEGSESAFRRVVEQYVDLVFSTALRRLGGDRHRAEDATQIVFTDLARKAKTLPPNVQLGGWLHRHCCFVVSNLCRAESRRAAREKEAVAMDHLHGTDANWAEVAPELDDAINSLQEEDREAIALRFFERQDFRAIGEAIGGSENAAQKRVARALEKLRHLLAERGVALSAAALLTALASEAIGAAPSSLAEKTSATALKHAGAKAAAVAGGVGAFAVALWVLGAAAVIGVVGIAITKAKAPKQGGLGVVASASGANNEDSNPVAGLTKSQDSKTPEDSAAGATSTATPTGPVLRLTIIAADTGRPVPNVPIEYRATEGKRWVNKDLQASRAGVALIPFTENTTELRLITRTEAFADTRLFWDTKETPIPGEYTLRLTRGVQIGGKVVNSRGELVPGANVNFNMPLDDPELARKTESHEVGSVHVTAEDGTWQTLRIPESILRRMHADASHPDYAGSEPPRFPMPNNDVELFLKGKHVFHLRDGMTVRGVVVNTNDEPVAGAKILVGSIDEMSSKEGVAGADGRFEINGCTPGTTMVTASAKGYGAKTLRVDSPPPDSYKIVLQSGHNLKIRIVDKEGQPIEKAYAWLETRDPEFIGRPGQEPLAQAKFEGRSDKEGRIEWDEAPALDLKFDFAASGYMRKVGAKVPADGAEHEIALLPALKISGTVRDAMTGAVIPKFRVIAGYPQSYIPAGETKPAINWSTLDRYWLQGRDGEFEKAYEEPVVYGIPENNYAFKIEADGYRPYITRVVKETEGEAKFDVALQPGGAMKLTVLSPNGSAASGVDVAFLRRTAMVRLLGRGMERQSPSPIRSTDAKGQVEVSDEDASRIAAAGPDGFALVNAADLGADRTIRLAEWGRVEGKITRRGKPMSDWIIHVGSDFQRDKVFIRTAATTSDENGRFTIEAAPPGKMDLIRMAPAEEPGTRMSARLRDIDVVPGQTANADYDDDSITVKVRVQWPDGFERTPRHKLFLNASTKFPLPILSPSERSDPAVLAAWQQRPDVKAAIAKMRHSGFAPSETEPDIWRSDMMNPGDWTINAVVIEQLENPIPGTPNETLLAGFTPLHIPESPAADEIDAGVLLLSKPNK